MGILDGMSPHVWYGQGPLGIFGNYDSGRTTQRKPMWLMPVSIICGRRAAGR